MDEISSLGHFIYRERVSFKNFSLHNLTVIDFLLTDFLFIDALMATVFCLFEALMKKNTVVLQLFYTILLLTFRTISKLIYISRFYLSFSNLVSFPDSQCHRQKFTIWHILTILFSYLL